MSALGWVGRNLPGLIAFGLAVWALVEGDHEAARFFLLLMVLFGISQQIDDVRSRVGDQ